MFNNKIEPINFDDAPIFYICPLCKNKGFRYIGDISHGNEYSKRRIFKCNNCNIVISEK